MTQTSGKRRRSKRSTSLPCAHDLYPPGARLNSAERVSTERSAFARPIEAVILLLGASEEEVLQFEDTIWQNTLVFAMKTRSPTMQRMAARALARSLRAVADVTARTTIILSRDPIAIRTLQRIGDPGVAAAAAQIAASLDDA